MPDRDATDPDIDYDPPALTRADKFWLWTAGITVGVLLLLIALMVLCTLIGGCRDDTRPSRDGGVASLQYVQPVQQPQVIVQHDDGLRNWMIWHSLFNSNQSTHTVVHEYHPAPTVVVHATPVVSAPRPAVFVSRPAAPAPTFHTAPARVSAIRTVSSPAHSMSAHSFGGHR